MRVELLEKIRSYAEDSKVNFQLACKKIDLSIRTNAKRAQWTPVSGIFNYLPPGRYPNLLEFEINMGFLSINHSFSNSIPVYSNLQKIEIEKCELNDTFIRGLLPLSQLQHLSLSSCRNITGSALRILLEHQKQLKQLSLEEATFESMDDMLFENMSELATLQIRRARSLTDRILGNLLAATPELAQISLVGFSSLEGHAFERLASSKLTTLSIGNVYPELFPDKQLNFRSFKKLLDKSTEIGNLSLAGNVSQGLFLPAKKETAFDNFPNLNRLDLNCIDINELQGLLRFGPSVKDLKLVGCRNSDGNIKKLISSGLNLSHLFVRYCDDITDADIQYLTKTASSLTSIKIENTKKRTGRAWNLTKLSQVCCLKLERDGNTGYTFDSSDFGNMMRSMPLLEHLFFNGPDLSANKDFGELNGVCKNLKSLFINTFDDMTDSVLSDLIYNARRLEKISLHHIKDTTSYILFPLIDRCAYLKELDINCPKILKLTVDDAKRYIATRSTASSKNT